MDLEKIENPEFIKNLSKKELVELAKDIRAFLIENISQTGGHLASNLGIVEITIALYYVFDYKTDKFLFDVGHQSYVHKILTGRAKDFKTLRKFNGLSGFTCISESEYDVWESGHSSNTISAMSGFLHAKNNNKDLNMNRVISIIGDSSIANGMAYEGLNYMGNNSELHPIVILNDNKMGISRSVGAMSRILGRLRGTGIWRGLKRICHVIFPKFMNNFFHQLKRGLKGFIQKVNIFEDLGYDYYGPIDGNSLSEVIRVLERIKDSKQKIVVHFLTEKGHGYEHAQNDMLGNYHGVPPFDIATGLPIEKNKDKVSYSEAVCSILCNIKQKEDFYVVTPAMSVGSKLNKFQELYPSKFIDVGIAEEHAATMCAGMALNNQKVVLMMYSTFAQRAYDQILNDICRLNLNVIIAIDRAGVVGEDGATHQGLYDVAMFNSMPNIVIGMPKDGIEMSKMFNYAFNQTSPFVIRYPKADIDFNEDEISNDLLDLTWEYMLYGKKGIVISYGHDLIRIENIIKENNLDVTLINARFIKPIDINIVQEILESKLPILVIEQAVNIGTLASNILEYATNNNYLITKFQSMGFNQNISIPHGKINEIFDAYNFGNKDILDKIKKLIE